MTRCPVNYFLPAADLLWGVFTLAQYKASNVTQLYALRFFVGALGGFFFPAVQWYLGSWYKRSELSRRGAIFFIASQVGSMSSGYIQAGAYARLDGRYGIEGWRWLYIICESFIKAVLNKTNRIRLCLHNPNRIFGLMSSPKHSR
jgi:MFS family permease